MKKWLCFLLAFGLMTTPVFAADDDDEWDDDDDDEEVPKKKAAPPPKKAKSSGTGRIGLAVSFSGINTINEQDKSGPVGAISFVYDMGNGLELGLGLGLHLEQYAAPDGGEAPDPKQILALIPSISYNLNKGLLDYGVGVDVGIIMEPLNYSEELEDLIKSSKPPEDLSDLRGSGGGISFNVFPHFYAKAELVKNVALKLSTGLNIYKPSGEMGRVEGRNMVMDLTAQGTFIFYFL